MGPGPPRRSPRPPRSGSQDPPSWPRPRRLDVHTDGHGLQPRPAAQAGGGGGV